MPTRAKVAVLKTQPESVLEDYGRLMQLADFKLHLDPTVTTILKDNISWHFPFPAANTTPWQLEGDDSGAAWGRLPRSACVQNQTVVTNAFKGEDLNGYVPIFRKYDIPVLYNFKPADMTWVKYPPSQDAGAGPDLSDGISIPDYFFGKNIVHLPTVKCHIYTTTTGAMKNAFGGLLSTSATTPIAGSTRRWSICWQFRRRSTPALRRHGWHHRGQRPGPRTMFPSSKTTSSPAPTRWPSTPWRPR